MDGQQPADAPVCQIEHLIHTMPTKGRTFGCALNLDQPPIPLHQDVEIGRTQHDPGRMYFVPSTPIYPQDKPPAILRQALAARLPLALHTARVKRAYYTIFPS